MEFKFKYPLGEDPEKDSVLAQLPEGYTSIAKVFYPFIRMPRGWKNSEDFAILRRNFLEIGRPVTWEEVSVLCGLESVAEVSIGLHAMVTGGRGRGIFQRLDLWDRIEENLLPEIYQPNEDAFSELLIRTFLKVLGKNGEKTFKFAKLHDASEEWRTYAFHDMTKERMLELCENPTTLTNESESIIFSCFFDELSAVCYCKGDVREALRGYKLEGVVLEDETPMIWEDKPHTYFYN
ncbi:DUF2711 family protein [Thalassobacillus hwangdonensis]|uniref:DUF2711 family protein n=1 Tax=Thalassobacillus hwangdonensis TaxID=546108 RepID=A0ABW3L1S0_9BACI